MLAIILGTTTSRPSTRTPATVTAGQDPVRHQRRQPSPTHQQIARKLPLDTGNPGHEAGTKVTSRLGTATTRGGGTLAPPAAASPPRPPLSVRLRRLDGTISPYLYIAPFFFLFLAFGLFPLVYTFYVSLTSWDLGSPTHAYVGLRNYGELLADPYFWNALRNTVVIWVLSTTPQLLAALGLAHVLNRRLKMRTLFRVGMLAPNVTSVAAVAIIFA